MGTQPRAWFALLLPLLLLAHSATSLTHDPYKVMNAFGQLWHACCAEPLAYRGSPDTHAHL